MTISGGIKFFERNTALFVDGTVATATSNTASANNILTNRQLVYWESIASDDTTTETIEITFNKTVTIDRVLLNRINFKQFTVKYDSASVWTDFTNVSGLDGDLVGGIAETTFSDEVAYYEVDSISTTGLQIAVLKSQVVDAEKIIYNLITTAELGTLEGYPKANVQFTRGARQAVVLSGLSVIQKAYEVNNISLSFSHHPYQSDITLVETLFDETNSFLVWLCGGIRGTDYFRYNIRGYALRDIYNMQVSTGMSPNYPNGIYINAPDNNISLVASV